IGGIVPFTVLKMLALNYKLVDSKRCLDRGHSWMQEMLRRWGKLHAVRAGASVLAFTGMLVAMACGSDRALLLLRKLVVENVRRLLLSLPAAVRKARATLEALLRKYYHAVLFDGPAHLWKTMASFNEWVVDVLSTSQPESIGWGTSHGAGRWLIVDEQPQDPTLEEVLAINDEHTIQLLKAVCEYYMARCDGLAQANGDLARQVGHLQSRMEEALARAFEMRQVAEREQELSGLRRQHLVAEPAFATNRSISPGEAHDPTRELLELALGFPPQVADVDRFTDGEHAEQAEEYGSASDSDDAGYGELAGDEPVSDGESEPGEDADLDVENVVEEEELRAPSPVEHAIVAREDAQSEATLSTEEQFPAAPSDINGGISYRQLTLMSTDTVEAGGWHRQALRFLTAERERRRLMRSSAGSQTPLSPPEVSNMASTALAMASPLEVSPAPLGFPQLAAVRDPGQDDQDPRWYRSALHFLNQEREHRLCDRRRNGSSSSTITIAD
ncbi:hypothetical protein BBJ28_00024668, partial [Nothophytophthora sp. Chile5]